MTQSKPVLFLKAHVETFTRKDGVVVQAHETKVQKKGDGDLGAGCWRKGHQVKIHAPGHELHGTSGEVTGRGHEHGFVNVKCSDGQSRSCSGHDLRPADTHHWPEEDGSQAKKAPPKPAPKDLDSHPSVIGKAEKKSENGHSFEFDGREYHKTGKSGTSLHDETPVDEYEHPESGHRVWKDAKDRVHADDHEDARRYRGE